MAKELCWIDPSSTLLVGGVTVSHGDMFDSGKVNDGVLKALKKQGKVGDKVVTEADITKLSKDKVADAIAAVKKQLGDEKEAAITLAVEAKVTELEGVHATALDAKVSELETAHADAIKVLKEEHATALAKVKK